MAFNFPNNIFITRDLERRFVRIKQATVLFKEKYFDIFMADDDDTYIDFKWAPYPVDERGSLRLDYEITYAETVPLEIRTEFDTYIKGLYE